MKKKKKCLAFNEFLGLIIALALLFFLIIYPGSKIYSSFTKQQYVNSYNKLVVTIEDMEKIGTSTDLIMDKNTAIIAFPKDSEEIGFKKSTTIASGTGGASSTIEESIPKPEICKDKACICLCQNFKEIDYKLVCEKNICNNFDNLDFFSMEDMRSNDISDVGTGWASSLIDIKGGILITRLVKEPKLRTVYIQKLEKVAICLESPCIENE